MFAVPANNKPVQIMGTQIIGDDTGEGAVTLLRIHGGTPKLQWSGVDLLGVERGSGNLPGGLIMFLDIAGHVSVQTASSTHIQVCDGDLERAAGYLTFVY